MLGEGGGVGRLNLSGLVLLLGEGRCLTKGERKKETQIACKSQPDDRILKMSCRK